MRDQILIDMNNRMLNFLEMPNWRKMTHIKSVFSKSGMTQIQLEKLLRKIKTHFELSLARNYQVLPHEIYQTIFDSNNSDRKFLRYRNNARFSRRS